MHVIPDAADRIARAHEAYLRGTFYGDDGLVVAAIEDVEADSAEDTNPTLLLAYAKLLHVQALSGKPDSEGERAALSRALERFRADSDVRGEAETLLWQGVVAQFFDKDDDAAEPLLLRSYALAAAGGDDLTRSYAARHLGFVAFGKKRATEARLFLRESLELRRRLPDFPAGVAAALLALGAFEREVGNHTRGSDLIDQAEALATEIGARRVLKWIAAVRSAATTS